ncbi:MAG: HlyD family efflux transporter periplasmic adaptor subunit [Anaerolineae bacterium]|nr:MAG: HlyD family efflux transporter periplasmic adaptor subunit [Anaerolineae bacterium]
MNKKLVIGIPVGLAVLALAFFGYRQFLAPVPATPTAGAGAVGTTQTGPDVISAEGRVQPARSVRLSFSSGGQVAEVLVRVGDVVTEGQPLARLEDRAAAEAALAAADLELEAAQQAFDALTEDLDLARAVAQRAVAVARADVRDSERRVTNLDSPSKQTEIDRAQANVVLLEDQLDKARDAYEPYADKPESNLTRAVLQQKFAAAQQAYDDAVRLLNNLEGTADEIDVATAAADLALARARRADAERALADLANGPDPDALALAERRLASAQAQRAAAQDALDRMELRAPFAGTVVSVDLEAGEFAVPGTSQVVLADVSAWEAETTDLSEGDVALLAVGMPVTVSLDAFPGETFEGVIIEIGLLGQDVRGQITYPVTVTFDPGDVPVRWGMTAFVDVAVED